MRQTTLDDITENWEVEMADIPWVGPYNSLAWGRLVEQVFSGKFRVWHYKEPKLGPTIIPVMEGGDLGRNGFSCGHIGYGGVFRLRSTEASVLKQTLDAIRHFEQLRGLPCVRVSLGPGQVRQMESEHVTSVMDLRMDSYSKLHEQYSSNIRSTLRKCDRDGIEATRLGLVDLDRSLNLIHQTQEAVGAMYRTPRTLLEGVFSQQMQNNTLVVGSIWEGNLLAVGVFVLNGIWAGHLIAGRDMTSENPNGNYAMLDKAIRQLRERGYHFLDLGYSHTAANRAFKRRWGATEVPIANFERREIEDKTSG